MTIYFVTKLHVIIFDNNAVNATHKWSVTLYPLIGQKQVSLSAHNLYSLSPSSKKVYMYHSGG